MQMSVESESGQVVMILEVDPEMSMVVEGLMMVTDVVVE